MATLYFSAVTQNNLSLLLELIPRFLNVGAEVFLVCYEGSISDALPPNSLIRVIEDQGGKWQLAKKYLQPELCAKYDTIFVWDDDIQIADFDVEKFIATMEWNELKMAQPSIKSPFGVIHPITQPHELGEDFDNLQPVGRFTNFVEVMVPVFSRDGWAMFYRYLSVDQFSGWGYDYIPMDRRGIIDVMHVVHTRPATISNSLAHGEMIGLFRKYGFYQYPVVNMGSLLLPISKKG